MKPKTLKLKIITKRRAYKTISVPSVMEVCPNCEARNSQHCGLCEGKNVIEVACEKTLAKYPNIVRAIVRYENEMDRDAWDAHNERVWGC